MNKKNPLASGKEELEPKESEDEFNYLCKAASNFANPQKDFHENSIVALQVHYFFKIFFFYI
jgi:hypothetical protein